MSSLQPRRLQPLVVIGLVTLVCAVQVIEDLYQSGQFSVSKN